MKKVLMLASVASMIDQFNMQNISILKEKGYEVHVAANFKQGSTSSNERIEQFKKELNYLNIPFYQIDFSRNVKNISQNIKAFNQIKKLMKNNKYEFVHCHSPIGGVCGRLAAKLTKTKVIYTAHGFHFYKGSSKVNWMIYYPIEKCLSYITDVLITINNDDYNLAKQKMKAKKIEYVPGVGVDVDKFKNLQVDKISKRKEIGVPDDAIMLFSVGELNKNKNHEVIIKSLAELNNSNVHYCIAGQGELDKYLIQLSEELNVSSKVHLLGFRSDVAELYKCADIFCFLSYREGLSVSLMEVMAAGLPVICSKIRGNVDLIQGENGGYLCKPSEVSEFVKFIEILVENKELRKSFGNYNMKYIGKFNVEIVNERMKFIYDSIDVNIHKAERNV